MPLILISSERFAEHQTPPGHPESPERARVMESVAQTWGRGGGEIIAPRPATDEELGRVHDAAYIRQIASLTGKAVALDPDTYTSPETVDVAALAAGAVVQGVEHVMRDQGTRALALVRPPGHHAESDHAMGFCFYNNIAVAARHARTIGAGRIAIVDYDVHHGNGTQHTFEADPDVLYVSVHQFPYYPGTGAADETGRGAGKGFTVNVPLEVGAVDGDYHSVFSDAVLPVVRQFKPDLVMVSAGFDAHERDPLAGMRLSTDAFVAMTQELRAVADEVSGGRLVLVTEGGYDLDAFAECLRGVVRTLAAERPEASAWPSSAQSSRAARALARVKAAHAGHWNLEIRT
jgi:acetoin utilization deacetylase AcuC-like enzyme